MSDPSSDPEWEAHQMQLFDTPRATVKISAVLDGDMRFLSISFSSQLEPTGKVVARGSFQIHGDSLHTEKLWQVLQKIVDETHAAIDPFPDAPEPPGA